MNRLRTAETEHVRVEYIHVRKKANGGIILSILCLYNI